MNILSEKNMLNNKYKAKRILITNFSTKILNMFVSKKTNYNCFFRFIEILDLVDDLVLDIPKVWLYLAEILCK